MVNRLPVRFAVSIMSCSSPLDMATGFSHTTAFPASSAWHTRVLWKLLGVATTMMSRLASASIAS